MHCSFGGFPFLSFMFSMIFGRIREREMLKIAGNEVLRNVI